MHLYLTGEKGQGMRKRLARGKEKVDVYKRKKRNGNMNKKQGKSSALNYNSYSARYNVKINVPLEPKFLK